MNRFLCMLGCSGVLMLGSADVLADKDPRAMPDIGVDKKLNQTIPLDLEFRDEAGRKVRLEDYFGKRPVLLAPVYYECPMLCTLILNGLFESTAEVGFNAGNEYEVVAFSFDHGETPELAAAKKAQYLKEYHREASEAGWHFLTGDASSIAELTRAIGFRYQYEAKTDEYAHPSSVLVLTPEGKISSYFHGIMYDPKDMRLALVAAGQGKIGNLIDQVILFCYHYDPLTGKYGFTILSALRILGLLTMFAIGAFIFVSIRQDRTNHRKSGSKKHEAMISS